MQTIPKTVTVTEKHEKWIKVRLDSGNYSNVSEYIRSLINQDEERETRVAAIRAALILGEESGVSGRSPQEIIESVKKAKGAKV